MKSGSSLAPLVSALVLALGAVAPATSARAAEDAPVRAANPCSGNPCAAGAKRRQRAANPCSGNPCAAGAKRRERGGTNPCAANPCAGSGKRRSRAENPCAGKN